MAYVENWHSKLHSHVTPKIGQEFVWGENDCVKFVSGCLEVIHGEDVTEGVITRNWNTKIGAQRAINEHDSFGDMLEQMGFREVPRSMMTTGDVIVNEDNVAIVSGGKVISSSPEEGIHVKDGTPPQEIKVYRFNG